jgi:hypothetical protein
MKKTLLIGYLFLLSAYSFALVPVEGLLLGEAVSEFQKDPLFYIFNDIYDKSREGENRKFHLYKSFYQSGILLNESCHLYQPSRYSSNWSEKQAQRSVVSTLQYIGLDTSIKAIGAYAKKLQLSKDDFENLSHNLTENFCSKNMTLFSLKRVKNNLIYYFDNPQDNIIPSVLTSPFVTKKYQDKTESDQARSNEFDQAISNFKAFCSWGGNVEDYRLLAPYLRDKFIMAFIIKNLMGVQDSFDKKSLKVTPAPSGNTVQVTCRDLICRKADITAFKQNFPTSMGSTGLQTDLSKLYCFHFKNLDYSSSTTIPVVKSWIKEMELENPILETGFLISLMTGVPDPLFGVENYQELPALAKSSIDERWSKWAQQTLNYFSVDMLFEESLKIKVLPRDSISDLRQNGFHLKFNVTLGEMDKVVDESDKLSVSFNIKLSKNYLRYMRNKWSDLSSELDSEGKIQFKEEVSRYINLQLKSKEKLFLQKVWNDEFPKLITQELLSQVNLYKGPLFNSFQDQVLQIPVKFSYGVFALNYLRYKSDVSSGRLKLNL